MTKERPIKEKQIKLTAVILPDAVGIFNWTIIVFTLKCLAAHCVFCFVSEYIKKESDLNGRKKALLYLKFC